MGRAADVVILAGNNPNLSGAVRQRHGGDRPGGNTLVAGAAILSFAGRLTHSWIIFSSPPLRVKASEWNSSCRIPAPAVIHCTSRTNHPAASGGVTMLYFTGVDDGDGFKSAMRMLTDAAFSLPAGKVYGPA